MKVLIHLFFVFVTVHAFSQGPMAEVKFHEGSNHFINGKTDLALKSVNDGLRQDPGHAKLQELKKLLEQKKKEEEKKEQEKKEQEKKQQEQQKKQEEQQKKDQQKQDQEKKEQEKKEQEKQDQEKKDNDNKEQKDEEKKEKAENDEKKQEQEQQEKQKQELPPDVKKRLEEMKISEEKAKMILEALKNREVQYLQENKRKSDKKPPSGKPDW